ncbi:MAG: ribosome silencing factor [Dehalococcoidia bacterium]|nr:ribosome silencing factor [Dehalococcoidia bacterium]
MESIDKARNIADIASQKQGGDIVVLDVRELCSFTDFFVICTSESGRQTEAISQDIEKAIKDSGESVLSREPDHTSGWVLLDLNDVIVHIFSQEEREHYQLEKLWSSAPVILRIQ